MSKAKPPAPPKQIAVIGAGWAGCTAAVELAARGHLVTLFEAARTLGGRARQVVVEGKTLDNGQHILLGAYRETLRVMQLAGIDLQHAFLRLPLQMRYPDTHSGMDFCAPRLPAPWHLLVALLRAKGLSRSDKMALARFSTSARWMGWELYQDCSVSELLQRFEQTPRLNRLMWHPLCIAALNTPPERASAKVFLRVLGDSLGAKRQASDMLIPKQDLSTLFPLAAAQYLREHGGTLHLGAAVKEVIQSGSAWKVQGPHLTTQEFDALVIATPAHTAQQLLSHDVPDHFKDWQAIGHEAITTVYLQYPASVRLPLPLYALLDDPDHARFGQFVFDRGHLRTDQAGLLAVVISAAAAALDLPQEALARSVASQLAHDLCLPQLFEPEWQQVISEKRATFACAPGLCRPKQATAFANLAIAGDYTEGPYPATLEAAVQSGVLAAQLLLAPSD